MRQTLFTIDHFLFEDHWLLIAWVFVGLLYLGYQLFAGSKSDALQFIPVFVIGAAIVHFVLPNLETLGVNPADPNGHLVPDGLAIRGYGVFLLLAMIVGFSLVLYRSQQVGVDGEKILTLGFWMVVAGIIGARLFYVIQKWDSFAGLELKQLLFKMVDMTSGGLVVYGSLIGGVVAATVYMAINKMPWRMVADILAPGMIIGLAIGRIGCLMNGCCYGGLCDDSFPGLYFPAGSAPYVQQLRAGQLFGITGRYDTDHNIVDVESVEAGGLADEYGVQTGDLIQVFLSHEKRDDPALRLRAAKQGVTEMDVQAVIDRKDSPSLLIPATKLPSHSLKTHPTQLYSSINAALLCMFLWFYFPYRKQPGEVFALLIILYPMGRFLLEIIRRDELGQFGTGLTISQWISVGTCVLGLAMFAYVRTNKEV